MTTKREIEAERDKQALIASAAADGLANLRAYLEGDKFQTERWVSVGDILARITEIASDMTDAEFTPVGWACPIKPGHLQTDSCHAWMRREYAAGTLRRDT